MKCAPSAARIHPVAGLFIRVYTRPRVATGGNLVQPTITIVADGPARILALPGTERIIADIARRIEDTCAAAFGPVISAAAKERILTLIDRTAGQRHSGTAPDDGWHVPATIIIGADGPAVTEEVFGPS